MPFEHDASLSFPTLKQHNLAIGRVYLVEGGPDRGQVFPSITRVLGSEPKPALERWKKRVGKQEAARVSRVATVQGGNVHKLSECYLENEELPSYGPNIAEMWKHLRPWWDENIVKVYAQEQNIYSRKLKVAGRLDLLALVTPSRRAVVDLKTSKKEKIEAYVQDYFLQSTFYAMAVYELTGVTFKHIILPVVNPCGLQVFESTPAKHFDELRHRINKFYTTYEPAANAVPVSV